MTYLMSETSMPRAATFVASRIGVRPLLNCCIEVSLLICRKVDVSVRIWVAYRVSHKVVGMVGLTWILSFTVCPILLGPMGIWQKWLGRWARWWNTQIKVNPTQVHEQMGHPAYLYTTLYYIPGSCLRGWRRCGSWPWRAWSRGSRLCASSLRTRGSCRESRSHRSSPRSWSTCPAEIRTRTLNHTVFYKGTSKGKTFVLL